MAVERKFVEDGLKRVQVMEYLRKELESAGFGGVRINRTPLGTQVIVYAERPGLIIGRGGRRIKRLTQDLQDIYGMENPQIDVREIENPNLNPQLMASMLARALERGWYFRRAGHTILQRIMDAGAKGCEITISGKLTGPRARTEKMIAGTMKHAGQPADDLVIEGFATAIKKLGVLGVRVRIIPPDVVMPDSFQILKEGVMEGSEEVEEIPEKKVEQEEQKKEENGEKETREKASDSAQEKKVEEKEETRAEEGEENGNTSNE